MENIVITSFIIKLFAQIYASCGYLQQGKGRKFRKFITFQVN